MFPELLTRVEVAFASRIFAAYGSIYIVASLDWLWLIENQRPDKWGVLGSIICLTGAVIILYGHRVQIY